MAAPVEPQDGRLVPVIVLTTSTARPVHEEALRAGADKVFVKPDSAA
jgi:CheY-like chemotaxis protein